jgi:hypothetical protein
MAGPGIPMTLNGDYLRESLFACITGGVIGSTLFIVSGSITVSIFIRLALSSVTITKKVDFFLTRLNKILVGITLVMSITWDVGHLGIHFAQTPEMTTGSFLLGVFGLQLL